MTQRVPWLLRSRQLRVGQWVWMAVAVLNLLIVALRIESGGPRSMAIVPAIATVAAFLLFFVWRRIADRAAALEAAEDRARPGPR
jgi:hypothetical protein